MNKREVSHRISNILFYLGLAIIFFWALAKSFGIIHSPPWQETLPYFGAIFTAGVAWNRFTHLEKRTDRIATGLTSLERQFHAFRIETGHRFSHIENQLSSFKEETSNKFLRLENKIA